MNSTIRTLLVVLCALFLTACAAPSSEDRARAAAEDIQAQMIDHDALALDQVLETAIVAEVQRDLTAIGEYQGKIDGEIDQVTVNAIQAFQRSVNQTVPWWSFWSKIDEQGMLDARTRDLLAQAASVAG